MPKICNSAISAASRTPQECVDRNIAKADLPPVSVALHRSAWIEILEWDILIERHRMVALHRSAWIEIHLYSLHSSNLAVALHRSAWIEILLHRLSRRHIFCRTPQECVDRNQFGMVITLSTNSVALHRSAWIEIESHFVGKLGTYESHSTGVRG